MRGRTVLGVLAAAVLVAVLVDELQFAVARRLRELGLDRGALMDAWVTFSVVSGDIRTALRLRLGDRGEETVLVERTFRLDQIPDPLMRAVLEGAGGIETEITDLLDD